VGIDASAIHALALPRETTEQGQFHSYADAEVTTHDDHVSNRSHLSPPAVTVL
jgi:hypothetical protein